jgi:SAM-dependent methyltransferase
MSEQFYETMLRKHHTNMHNTEHLWDLKAKDFNKAQKKHGMAGALKVTQFLLSKGMLANSEVLDVGGGTGRHAIAFAEYAREVTVTDISAQMLELAQSNAKEMGRRNIQYIKTDWEKTDLKSFEWEKRFDFVFASMCPAVRSRDGIDKMTAASKGWCQINQLIEMTDNITQNLIEDLKVEMTYDPHNDRSAVRGIFNLLWLQGFEPEINYIREYKKQVLSVDEALMRYSQRFEKAAAEKHLDIKRLLLGYADDDQLIVESRATLAMILWKV